jgi:hypothetical protein
MAPSFLEPKAVAKRPELIELEPDVPQSFPTIVEPVMMVAAPVVPVLEIQERPPSPFAPSLDEVLSACNLISSELDQFDRKDNKHGLSQVSIQRLGRSVARICAKISIREIEPFEDMDHEDVDGFMNTLSSLVRDISQPKFVKVMINSYLVVILEKVLFILYCLICKTSFTRKLTDMEWVQFLSFVEKIQEISPQNPIAEKFLIMFDEKGSIHENN